MNYSGQGTDRKTGRITNIMQFPQLHKGENFRVVADKPVENGDVLEYGTDTSFKIISSKESGDSEFKGLKNYLCRAEGY